MIPHSKVQHSCGPQAQRQIVALHNVCAHISLCLALAGVDVESGFALMTSAYSILQEVLSIKLNSM